MTKLTFPGPDRTSTRSLHPGEPVVPPSWRATLLAIVLAITAVVAASCGSPDSSVTTPIPPSEPVENPVTADSDPATSSSPEPESIESVLAGFFNQAPPGGPFLSGTSEHLEYLVACLEYAGIAATVGENPPHLSFSSPTGDPTSGATYEKVLDFCRSETERRGWALPSPFEGPDRNLELMYELWLGTHECLQAHGYPTVDPPSLDVFLDSGGKAWNPYQGFPSPGLLIAVDPTDLSPADKEHLEAQELCPGHLPSLLQELEATNERSSSP